MPHVDDGTLHALLDGALRAEDPARADSVEAHLDSCPDCRALRDHAADLRGRAAGILATLEPDARPDFQEVLARAGHAAGPAGPAGLATGQAVGATAAVRGAQRSRSRQARATRAVAWAATIVLALGTGYLIRDLVEPDAIAPSRTAASPERSAPEPIAADREPIAADREPADRGSDRAAGEAPGPGERAFAAEAVEPPAPAGTPPARVATTQARDATTQVAGTPVPADQATRRVPDAPPALETDVAAITIAPTALAEEPVVVGARPGTRDVPVVAAQRATDDAVGQPTIRLRGATPTVGTGFMAIEELPAGEGWSAITVAEARELMEGPVFVLPGAVVVGMSARGDGAAAEVRSVQHLDGAVALVVTQRFEARLEDAMMAEAAAPRPPAAPAAPERNVATARHDRHWITVAGRLPAETLQALAASAAPVPVSEDEPAHPPR